MPTIRVKFKDEYSWLASENLAVYAYQDGKFLVWDPVCDEWVWIPMESCLGATN